MQVYEIKVPGATFQRSMEAMRLNLNTLATDRLAISFDIFFNYFSLAGNNSSLTKQLRDRGSFYSSGANSYVNLGNVISGTIYDIGPDRRQMTLYIAPQLTVSFSSTASELDISFGDGEILLGIDELPEELGYGTSFVLRRILWNAAGARYFAEEDGLPENRLEIFVDVTLNETVFVAGIRGLLKRDAMPVRLSWRLAEGGCCNGFQVKEPPRGPLCVNLHARLVTNANVDVARLIAATNEIFNTRNVTIHLATTERLNLPQFFDLEVGQCVSNEFTAEQSELYQQHRGQAGANDICAFFVDSLTSNTGNVIGCAAHPPGVPSLAVMVTGTTQWCLAHEIGHVLGLSHVDQSNTDNLMRPIDQFTNPPPDLTPGQGGTMRWSRLLFSC
ncbi:zinc-dependent metalloprotease family protein [Pseudomonas germanica]